MIKSIPPNGILLTGDMWWNDPSNKGHLHRFILFPDRIFFDVEHDHWKYACMLGRRDGDSYQGAFEYSGGAGSAWCRLVEERAGEYRLTGTWRQTDSPERFEWHAALD